MSTNPAIRVVRGWLAASVCAWTAFAAHAHAAPTKMSLVVMLLITCVSAVIAMGMLGRKFSLWATSLVVVLSQGLYHLSLSVMSHSQTGAHLGAAHGAHEHLQTLPANITQVYAGAQSESMIWAHALAAVVSIVVLNGAERILRVLRTSLSLRPVRIILARVAAPQIEFRFAPGYFPLRFSLKLAQLIRLPQLRGPPSLLVTR